MIWINEIPGKLANVFKLREIGCENSVTSCKQITEWHYKSSTKKIHFSTITTINTNFKI